MSEYEQIQENEQHSFPERNLVAHGRDRYVQSESDGLLGRHHWPIARELALAEFDCRRFDVPIENDCREDGEHGRRG